MGIWTRKESTLTRSHTLYREHFSLTPEPLGRIGTHGIVFGLAKYAHHFAGLQSSVDESAASVVMVSRRRTYGFGGKLDRAAHGVLAKVGDALPGILDSLQLVE